MRVLDTQMKISVRHGCLKEKKRAACISIADEDELWRNGSFGWSSGAQLIRTLIYHLGLHLSLRASQEHRDLEFGHASQLKLCVEQSNTEYLQYVKRISKNHRFGLKCARLEPKVTRIYPISEGEKERCVVALYKKYISHRPESHGRKGQL